MSDKTYFNSAEPKWPISDAGTTIAAPMGAGMDVGDITDPIVNGGTHFVAGTADIDDATELVEDIVDALEELLTWLESAVTIRRKKPQRK